MIYFLGDLHGDWMALHHHEDKFNKDDIIIQVGDFGFYPTIMPDLDILFPNGYPCTVYVIDGNHEDFNFLGERVNGNELWEFHPNMFYVPRGTVMEINGYLIGFLGGAESVDVAWRTEGYSWWPEERVTEADVQKLIDNVNDRQLDVLVTHAPPPPIIKTNWPLIDRAYWQLPLGWEDISSQQVQVSIDVLNPHKVVCGHMHRSVVRDNVRILDINEFRDMERL